jgi:hypothetical protein
MLVNLNSANAAVNVVKDIRSALSAATVVVTTTATIALAANAFRSNYMIYNSGSNTVYLREGTAPVTGASPSYNVIIPPGFLWKEDFPTARYTGTIHAITASGSTSLQVSEGTLQ